mgnify:CR=1 FL=1
MRFLPMMIAPWAYRGYVPIIRLLKITFCMKVSCFVITAVLCGTQALMAGSGYAQDIDRVSITLELRNEPLKDAFKKIEQLSSFRFAYKEKEIKRCEAVTLPAGTRSLRATLSMILNNTSLEFKQVGSNVIVYHKKDRDDEPGALPPEPEHFTVPAFDGGVKGKVINTRGEPLAGASITIAGTDKGTSADSQGEFSISGIKAGRYRLQVTAVGYANQIESIEITDDKVLDITISLSLNEGNNSLEDVVVIGYQNVVRRKTTAAISTVKGKDFENTPYPSFDAMLQGRVAGLNILSVSGEPGANSIVNIRGNSSVNNANGTLGSNGISTPLYVIDGVVFDVSDIRTAYGNSNPLTAINPNDIESIDVLKDASAAAIYGARAANGVIIVKTKRPRTGRPQFRLSTYVGVTTRPAQKPVTVGKAERWLKLALIEEQRNYVQQGNLSQFLTDSLNPAFNNNTDWQDLFVRDAIVKNVDINLGGAEERFAYRISVNRYEEDGVLRGYNLQRTTPRLFLSFKPYRGIEVTTDLYMGFTKALHGSGQNVNNPYPFSIQAFPSSFWRITEEVEKTYTGRNDQVRDDDRATSVNGNTRVIANLGSDFQFISSFSYNFNWARRDYLQHRSITGNTSNAIHYSNSSRRWEIENYLTYNKTLGDHSFTGLLGQGAEENTVNVTEARANGIPFDAIQVIQGVPSGPNLSASTLYEQRSRVSLFARVGYEYKGRYAIDGSFRRDASSRYASSSRWAPFPAVSGRWTISEEPFFQRFLGVINFLKIRGSYGITGRDPGSYYAQYRQLTTNNNYTSFTLGAGSTGNLITYNGVTAVRPDYLSAAPAANITWERAPQSNIGVDINFLNDRFTLTVDLYSKDSRELVFNIPVPITTGYTTATNNFVDVRNRGIELTLTTNNLSKKSPLKWNTTFNVAFNENFVTRLPAGNRDFVYGPSFFQRTLTIGQPLHSFVVWNVPFVYATNEDVPVDPYTGLRIRHFGGAFYGAGDGAKQDINGDYNIDLLDKIIGGDPQPKVYGGIINNLAYKNFTLQVLATFVTGRKLWNSYVSDKLASAANNPYDRWGRFAGPAAEFGDLDIWRKPGDEAGIPNLFNNAVDNTNISSSLFIEDASFFRLKTVYLGYALPARMVNRFRLKGVRFYSTIDNLFVLYSADVPDPEAVGVDGVVSGSGYPQSKKFTLGVDIQF